MIYILSCVWLDYMVQYFQCKNCVGSSPKTKKCVASFLVPVYRQGPGAERVPGSFLICAEGAHARIRCLLHCPVPRKNRLLSTETDFVLFSFCYYQCVFCVSVPIFCQIMFITLKGSRGECYEM